MIFRGKENGIAFEFAVPVAGKENGHAIVLCDGFPAVPYKKHILARFVQMGYVTFHPRYSGSWESDGIFLQHPPEKDIESIAKLIKRGWVTESYFKERKKFGKIKKIHVIGGSFGGSVALRCKSLNSLDKIVSLSPVIDFSTLGRSGGENLENTKRFVEDSYGQCYRINSKLWQKNITEGELNPSQKDDKRVLILSSIKDPSVPFDLIEAYASKTKAKLIPIKEPMHLSVGSLSENQIRLINLYLQGELKDFGIDEARLILKKKLKNVLGENLVTAIAYGGFYFKKELGDIEDIDLVIIVKNRNAALKRLSEIFSDIPLTPQVKVFTNEEIEEVKKRPEEFHLHTTSIVLLRALKEVAPLVGRNPFKEIELPQKDLIFAARQKARQYLAQIEMAYIKSEFSYRIAKYWLRKVKITLLNFETSKKIRSQLNKELRVKDLKLAKESKEFQKIAQKVELKKPLSEKELERLFKSMTSALRLAIMESYTKEK